MHARAIINTINEGGVLRTDTVYNLMVKTNNNNYLQQASKAKGTLVHK